MNDLKFELKKVRMVDPRIAITRQIGWIRPTAYETEYSVPEPDDYNFAIYAQKPVDCTLLEDQVFYKKLDTNMWWSVYYVPDNKKAEFLRWMELQDIGAYWSSNRSSTFRKRRPMLYTRKNKPELTTEERLYAMGYYTNLAAKYFSEDDTMLLERLGPARAEIWNDFSE